MSLLENKMDVLESIEPGWRSNRANCVGIGSHDRQQRRKIIDLVSWTEA